MKSLPSPSSPFIVTFDKWMNTLGDLLLQLQQCCPPLLGLQHDKKCLDQRLKIWFLSCCRCSSLSRCTSSIKPLFVESVWLIAIFCCFDYLYILLVPLQREGRENPVLLLKEDSTIWKDTLLGALECKLNWILLVIHLCLHCYIETFGV